MATKTRKPQRDRHQEILEAASRVITDRGLAETRIQDIADACGVSPGLILYYFESKDRLLVEALTYTSDQFYLRTARELRKMPSARDRLIVLVMARAGLRRGEVCGLRRGDVHLLADSRALGCEVARAHLHVVRREDNPNRV